MNDFLKYRPRRLRRNETLRRMVRETAVSVSDLIYPLFVVPGRQIKHSILSMPGVFHFSIDLLVEEAKETEALGIPAVILFGIPEQKDAVGSEGYADNGIIQRAVAALKSAVPNIIVITDVCMCEYTDHGHCGILCGETVDNDATLELLARTALSHARSGADIIAPSDMMDGRVERIREELDKNGFSHVPVMSYAAKYASDFYGPFREAADSAPKFGDRRSYQMDPPNAREALREVAIDIEEGADIVMVKPALPYLDIIRLVRDTFDAPVAAYNVSGEYSMIKAAVERGWLDGDRAMMEMLVSIKRAGADMIISYYAKEAAQKLQKSSLWQS
jgi:porphobilinogen synthase